MSTRFPEYVDPWRLADLEKRMTGELELARMPRLAGAVLHSEGNAVCEIRFEKGSGGRPVIKGEVRAVLALQCQRCLEQLDFPVDAALNLAVIEAAEEAVRLADEFDPVLAEDGRIGLRELIEEELLLAIPQVPRHDPAACAVDSRIMAAAPLISGRQQEETTKANPFAVLSGLKGPGKS